MAVRAIVKAWADGSEVLRKPAQRVQEFGPGLHQLLDDMVETMRDAPGVGLAAPQVGISQRITVVEYPEDEEDVENTLRLYELINPEIIKSRGNEEGQEGCLSLPGLLADVDRATYVLVKAQDRMGQLVRIKAFGWLARIFQHEIDHLHGVLMLERANQVYKMQEEEDGSYTAVPIESLVEQGG